MSVKNVIFVVLNSSSEKRGSAICLEHGIIQKQRGKSNCFEVGYLIYQGLIFTHLMSIVI